MGWEEGHREVHHLKSVRKYQTSSSDVYDQSDIILSSEVKVSCDVRVQILGLKPQWPSSTDGGKTGKQTH